MREDVVKNGSVVSCTGIQTRDWYAWNNLTPPKPDDFHVVGEVLVGNPGIVAMLFPKEPPGINSDILLMDLILVQMPGIWPQMTTWVPARYDKVLVNSKYKQVEIFCEGIKIADMPVHDVQ